MTTNLFTLLEEEAKKTKRLVAISLRPDFQRMFPWEPNSAVAATPDDAASRAQQMADKVRSLNSERAKKQRKDD